MDPAVRNRLVKWDRVVVAVGRSYGHTVHIEQRLRMGEDVTRRAERLICQLAEQEPVNSQALIYTNRASDLLFVLGRHLNADGSADVLWKAGANQ